MTKSLFAGISRPLLIVSLVSLFTDISSELLYPILPIFLATNLQTPIVIIGAIEGIAEITAGVSKGYFGGLSDRFGQRKIFVMLGYALSAISKPMPILWLSWLTVLVARVLDRIGKGIRTAPRDALIAAYSTPATRGLAFGFHRAMDTIGAALGPVFALLWLWQFPQDYRSIFILAFIPAAIAVGLTFLVQDNRTTPTERTQQTSVGRNLLNFWQQSPSNYRRLVIGLLVFALFNSSDVFLILRSRSLGFSDTAAIGGYIFYNLVYAVTSYSAGKLSDRVGRKAVLITGFGFYIVAYLGFALANSVAICWVMFALYGIYAAMTEGIAKAWVADLTPQASDRGSSLGIVSALSSIAALVASVVAGILWSQISPAAPFYVAAFAALITVIIILPIASRSPANGN